MTDWRYAPAETGVVLDFVAALPVSECMRRLRSESLRFAGQRLCVRQTGQRLLVEVGWQQQCDDEQAGLWLLRFDGMLTPVSGGTHVCGPVVRNGTLEMLLTIPGLITAVFAVLGIALAVPFIAALSVILLGLFAAYYVTFQKLLNRLAHDLARWLTACLTQTTQEAGESLP